VQRVSGVISLSPALPVHLASQYIVFSAYPTPTTVQRVARQTLGSEVVNNDISKLRAIFWRAQPTASSLAAFSHGYTKPGEDDDEGISRASRHLYEN
jgi:hypothetical protein